MQADLHKYTPWLPAFTPRYLLEGVFFNLNSVSKRRVAQIPKALELFL